MPPPQPVAAANGIASKAGRPPRYAALLASIAVVCACIIGLDAWRTWTARESQLAAARVETANLTRSLAQHAHDTLGTADTLLVSLRESVEASGTGPTHLAHLRRLLASQIATVPMLRDLMVFDAAGYRLVNSGRPAPEVENILDRAYFQYHAAHGDRTVHVGPPVRGKLDGTWIITVSRRVSGPGGEFAGVVAATFSIRVIRQFYETFDIGKQGFIGLNTVEGMIITRFPAGGSNIGDNIGGSFTYSRMLATSPTGEWRATSPLDGFEHLGSYRVVDGFPLVVVVGYGVDELLVPWRMDALIHFGVSLLASAMIAALGLWHVRTLKRQHEAEQETQRRERKYRLLADNNTDLIIQADVNLHIVYASPASRALLGLSPDQLVGTHIHQLVPPDDWPGMSAALAAATEGAAAPALQHRLTGRDIWAETSARRLEGGDGLLLVMRDITARQSVEVQLRQAQRMEAVGQLTAGVAHDFNNMLQTQCGALELLLKDVAGQPKATRYANMALGAAGHAARLTHSLLSFSRQQVLDPEPVEVEALLARLEPMLSIALGPQIALSVETESGLDPLFADAAQLEAALVNLSRNARDAMPEGGRLLIQACTGAVGPDRPESQGRGAQMQIIVSDTGTGMSAATLAQACEPFFTTKEVGKGSGLGLSMVQGFVRQSGGSLRIQSVLGQGTQVELWLPTAIPKQQALPIERVMPRNGKGRVLLVEDAGDVMASMADILESVGFKVIPVASGEAALGVLAAAHEIDALVTDFAMPGIDGGELARRATALRPGLPIVVTTGFAEMTQLRRLPPGAAVLRKPVTGEILANCVAELLTAQSRSSNDGIGADTGSVRVLDAITSS